MSSIYVVGVENKREYVNLNVSDLGILYSISQNTFYFVFKINGIVSDLNYLYRTLYNTIDLEKGYKLIFKIALLMILEDKISIPKHAE